MEDRVNGSHPEEPPIERFLGEHAGLLTGLLLAAAGGFTLLALFGRGKQAGAALCPASLCVLAALLPGWFLLRRRAGRGPALVCGQCTTPVTSRGGAGPLWFDADTVDYWCDKCQLSLCGRCATSTPTYSESLQSLKAKYKASGAALKAAIDADPRALFEKGELDPICPKCQNYLRQVGRVL